MNITQNSKCKNQNQAQSAKFIVILCVGLSLIFIVIIVSGLLLLNRKEEKNVEVAPIQNIKREKSGFTVEEYQPEKLSVDRIFQEDHKWVATLPSENVRTLIVTGDIILGRMVNYKMVSSNNFKLPFEKTADFLNTGDITFSNFESPLINNCPTTGEGMIFCGDKRGVEGLIFSGIDVVSLANNHIGNYGINGIKETEDVLKNNGILFTGTTINPLSEEANLAVKDIRGIKFGFLGYNFVGGKGEGVMGGEKEEIKNDILKSKPKVDILTVMFHFGEEYTSSPSGQQRELSYLAIENGADLVVGNHPHWVQGLEFYPSILRQMADRSGQVMQKLIVYSHGNFIFDQEWSRETKEGVIGKYTFYGKELVDAQFFPILIEDYNQPKPLYGEEARKIIERMRENSK